MAIKRKLRLIKTFKELKKINPQLEGEIHFLVGLSDVEFPLGTIFNLSINGEDTIVLKLVDIIFYNKYIKQVPIGSRVVCGFSYDIKFTESLTNIKIDKDFYLQDLLYIYESCKMNYQTC